jgi:predicted RNA polymerase sigma factor
LLDSGQPARAQALLDPLPPEQVAHYQPYWVTLSRLAAAIGAVEDAGSAAVIALSLTTDPALRAYLTRSLTLPQ